MTSGPDTPAGGDWPHGNWPVHQGPGPGVPRRSPVRSVTAAVIAVLAAALGAGVALAIVNWPSASPTAASSASASPAPGGGAGTGNAPGGGGSGGTRQMLLVGKVTAVSSTSITIGGNGQSVTAAVTGSARFTGRVSSISGVRVGDEVTAQLTATGGTIMVSSIQDPAGNLPASLPTSIPAGA
jgi:hypothetical protein